MSRLRAVILAALSDSQLSDVESGVLPVAHPALRWGVQASDFVQPILASLRVRKSPRRV